MITASKNMEAILVVSNVDKLTGVFYIRSKVMGCMFRVVSLSSLMDCIEKMKLRNSMLIPVNISVSTQMLTGLLRYAGAPL